MKLTDDEKARFIRVAPESLRRGRVDLQACVLCGSLQWKCSDSGKPDELVVNTSSEPCGRCQDVFARAPELSMWVLDVTRNAIRKAAVSNGDYP